MAELTIYDTRHSPAQLVHIESVDLHKNISYAVYRFWVAERRMPAAIVMSEQLARAFTDSFGAELFGDLRFYGYHHTQSQNIPVLGRPAYIDPLFTLI